FRIPLRLPVSQLARALASSEEEHVTGVTFCPDHLHFELDSLSGFSSLAFSLLLQVLFFWLIFCQIFHW
ncbi:hypothetical protein LEMLEM_LOCUS24111, partial [Lemmus lemmus]